MPLGEDLEKQGYKVEKGPLDGSVVFHENQPQSSSSPVHDPQQQAALCRMYPGAYSMDGGVFRRKNEDGTMVPFSDFDGAANEGKTTRNTTGKRSFSIGRVPWHEEKSE